MAGKPRHGMKGTSEYNTWSLMRHRCTNPNSVEFHRYGGRGLSVCKRWDKFENFISDMGRRPSPKHSIDRIDNNLGYSPENCRWATASDQALNRRDNHKVTFDNRTQTVMQWARELGINHSTLYKRLNVSKLSMADIFSTKSHRGKR